MIMAQNLQLIIISLFVISHKLNICKAFSLIDSVMRGKNEIQVRIRDAIEIPQIH